MSARRPRLAFWFRYGPAEHTELCHAIPKVIEELSRSMDVEYYGMRGPRPTPPEIERHARVRILPLRVNRQSTFDKFFKTALWILVLPFLGIYCRVRGVDAVYIDETIPGSALLARVFFGRTVAITVADIFVDVYLASSPLKRAIARFAKSVDFASWRRLPAIMTRAKTTKDYLVQRGVKAERVFPIYDPCDMSIYHPADRAAARAKYGYARDHVVLVHHGILHPNKGNDRVLQSLARVRAKIPGLRYLLVGNGPEMPRLKQLAAELKIADIVTFTGWLPALTDVNTALNAGDIGLVMRVGRESDHFHLTGALVHSLACGLPVLAARLGGVAEVVEENVNGLLFSPDDMGEFEKKLVQLAGDPEARRRYGAAALETARKNFDMDTVVKQTCDMLRMLVAGKI